MKIKKPLGVKLLFLLSIVGACMLIGCFPKGEGKQNAATVSPIAADKQGVDQSLKVKDNIEIEDGIVSEYPDIDFQLEGVQLPEFPDSGMLGVMAYLRRNSKYPLQENAQKRGDRVIVQFVITEKGEITEAKVVRGVNPLLDKEALRLVKSMPAWKPAIENGKAISMKFALPVTFFQF